MKNDRIGITLANIKPSRELQFENYQLCSLVQALLGSITPNMVAISMRCLGDTVHILFLLDEETPEDKEEIEDIVFELDALQCTNVPIETHVWATTLGHSRGDLLGRFVFIRRACSR